MEDNKKGIKSWVKQHKKGLIIAGIGIGVGVGAYFGLKYKDSIKDALKFDKPIKISSQCEAELASPIPAESVIPDVIEPRKYTKPTEPYVVSMHLMVLPEGRKRSAEKTLLAKSMDWDLPDNVTIVKAYPKYVNAAA